MRNHAGYTLTELMTVIGIIAILTAIVMPNFLGWRSKHKLDRAVGEVIGVINLSKSRAVKDGTTVRLAFNTANQTYRAFRVDSDATVTSGSMPAGIELDTDTLGATVNFNSEGLASASGSLKLDSSDGRSETIEVSLTGSCRLN